jgi:saccharopine dehydrogenase (NADP+, L-glutamate forming)
LKGGVLLASRNDAFFLENGQDVKIEGKVLFDNYKTFNIPSMGDYEGYPNRNSKQYIEIYKIPEVQTIIRGTFRNVGWCQTIKKIADLGYLSIDPINLEGQTFKDLMELTVGKSDDLKQKCAEKIGLKSDHEIVNRLEWMGLFSDKKIPPKLNTKLDALCSLFKEKLVYKEGERDMLLMQHTFIAQFEEKKQTITSTLVDFGIKNGDTSMSRTVSLPVAICVKLVATGKVKLTGLQTPVIPELYHPILDELETMGIVFKESFGELKE